MNSKDVNESLVGKTVTWTSQSHGSKKTKTGTVVALVHGGVSPDRLSIVTSGKYRTSNSMPYPGLPRDHNSLLVNVNGDLYWPRVSLLEVE